MPSWTSVLKSDPTAWLLEESNPSVRYLTLTNLLDRGKKHPEVKRARAEIMRSGIVPRILSRQSGDSWNSPGRFYVDKYKGTVWQLIILAEHEADGDDKRIRAACEHVLRCSQDPESHGFSYKERGRSSGGRHEDVIPCLTGNMIWSLLKLGFQDDERAKKGVEWIASYQRFDDGNAKSPEGWPYDRYEMCWGRHSCHMGVIKSLKALSAVPKGRRNSKVEDTIRRGCDHVLAHHIYKKSHDLRKVSRPGWLRLQFPLMYQTDILEVAGILVDLGVKDKRMEDAMDRILAKQSEKGQWALESTFNGRFQFDIEEKNKPSKWITYRALKVLKAFYE